MKTFEHIFYKKKKEVELNEKLKRHQAKQSIYLRVIS